MANEVLHKTGTPVVWADTTDFNGTDFTRTHQMNMENLATVTAWQGAKADLGATRARQYAVRLSVEFVPDTDPTAGATVDVYWSSSPNPTAATANDGGASGADEIYKDNEEAEWFKQLMYLGSLVVTADHSTVVQKAIVGIFTPPQRYGMPVVFNGSAIAFEDDAVEMYVALIPIIDEIQ